MKKICSFFFAGLIFSSINIHAQTTVPAANTLLKNALATAAAKNKKVLLMFHASWCGWCHKMDSAINDISCKKFFDDNFVIVHLTVMESKGKENLENPGGAEMLLKYNGKDQGIPYWLIFDREGLLLFDSQKRTTEPDGKVTGRNIGCPASKTEVEYFISLLGKTTSLTTSQLDIIAKRFRQNEN